MGNRLGDIVLLIRAAARPRRGGPVHDQGGVLSNGEWLGVEGAASAVQDGNSTQARRHLRQGPQVRPVRELPRVGIWDLHAWPQAELEPDERVGTGVVVDDQLLHMAPGRGVAAHRGVTVCRVPEVFSHLDAQDLVAASEGVPEADDTQAHGAEEDRVGPLLVGGVWHIIFDVAGDKVGGELCIGCKVDACAEDVEDQAGEGQLEALVEYGIEDPAVASVP